MRKIIGTQWILLLGFAGLFLASRTGSASSLIDAIAEMEREKNAPPEDLYRPPTSGPVTLRYTTEQIDTIQDRARQAWKDYLRLRRDLRRYDPREQAYARRARALRFRLRSLNRLIKDEKKNPTHEGPVSVAEALTWLDRATADVEYDHNRIVLRMKRERISPEERSYSVCGVSPLRRVPPRHPGELAPIRAARLALAAGETASFQLVVVPYWQELTNVRVTIEPFFQADSIARFKGDRIRVWLVESILHLPGVGRREFWEDPIAPLVPFDVPASSTQALLVEVSAEDTQQAGLYRGRILVEADDAKPTEIDLAVEVWPFSIASSRPDVALWIQNPGLKSCFSADQPMEFAGICQEFLAQFGLRLFRPDGVEGSVDGRQPWMPDRSTLVAAVDPDDPYSVAAGSTLPFRQAAWARWRTAPEQDSARRWIIRDWVTADQRPLEVEERPRSPLVQSVWSKEAKGEPPGVIHINWRSLPEPTLRLVALRDGIEDFAYLNLLKRRLREAKTAGAVGWWRGRKYRKLLEVESGLVRRDGDWREREEDVLRRREAIAMAIAELERAIREAKMEE